MALFASAPWAEVMSALRHARERHASAARGLAGLDPAQLEAGQSARRLLELPATHDGEHVPAILEWRREHGY